MKSIIAAGTTLLIIASLTGCGQTGSLYLPQKPEPQHPIKHEVSQS